MTVHHLVPRRLAGLVASTLMLLAIVLLTAAPSSARATVAEAMAADARVHQDGGFEEALVHWERARMQAQDSGDVQAQARPLRGAAQLSRAGASGPRTGHHRAQRERPGASRS